MSDQQQDDVEAKQSKLHEDRVIGESITNSLPKLVELVRGVMSENPKLTAEEATKELLGTLEKLNASAAA